MVSRRGLMKAGAACAGAAFLETCFGPAVNFSDPEPAELEKLVAGAIQHVSREEFRDAESILEKQYKWHNDDIGYCALLGIAQAGNRHYSKADSTFRDLIDAFEEKPEKIITIRDCLSPLFQAESFKALRQRLRKAAAMTFPKDLSDLYIVDGFLSMAEYKFDAAILSFAQVIPKHMDKIVLYKCLMDKLAEQFSNAGNTVARDGYRKMSVFFRWYTPNPFNVMK